MEKGRQRDEDKKFCLARFMTVQKHGGERAGCSARKSGQQKRPFADAPCMAHGPAFVAGKERESDEIDGKVPDGKKRLCCRYKNLLCGSETIL